MVIDLQGLLKSGVLTGLSKGKRKIGMGGTREGGWVFLNERPVPVDYDQHAIDRYLRVAKYLGCESSSWKGEIPVSESDKKWVNDFLNADGIQKRPLVVINPIARWKTKLWEPERFAVLADRITDELSCEVLFTGSNMDRGVIEDISKKMKGRSMNLAGRTSLKQLAHLYTKCAALVTTDTGPMHIGAAMGCPVVALFGPTAPWRTGPRGQAHKVIRADLECSPCFKKKCNDMSCMKEITVGRVFEAVKNMLTLSPAGERAGVRGDWDMPQLVERLQ
jgi:3-deoxy-D-manno-octulosonic-acid transferase/heptosyltransferase-1